MSRTRIKICGVMRSEDALMAARAGADSIGLVLYANAPRRISLKHARDIIATLPPFVTVVGLFVNAPAEEIIKAATYLRLGHVQLHGNESPKQVKEIEPLRVIKALRVDPARLRKDLDDWREAIRGHSITNLAGFVLETAGTGQPGGTGVANNWAVVQKFQAEGLFDQLPPLIAAGGLTPQTVGDVVRTIRPWAVDVSSGVEETLGQKSEEKVAAFVKAVREQDAR